MVKTAKDNRSTNIWDSIYRQWIWADHLRTYFGNALPEKELDLSGDFTIEAYWIFMSLWYGILFSVIEALKEIRVEVPEVQKDIDQMYLILKRYRNAVFHVQTGYWTEKWRRLVLDEASSEKIHKIHKRVGIFLLETLKMKGIK